MRGERIGFVGTGVMGEPMCRNLVRKHDGPVTAHDLDPAPLARLAADGAGVVAAGAALVKALFAEAIESGLGARYHPVTATLIDRKCPAQPKGRAP